MYPQHLYLPPLWWTSKTGRTYTKSCIPPFHVFLPYFSIHPCYPNLLQILIFYAIWRCIPIMQYSALYAIFQGVMGQASPHGLVPFLIQLVGIIIEVVNAWVQLLHYLFQVAYHPYLDMHPLFWKRYLHLRISILEYMYINMGGILQVLPKLIPRELIHSPMGLGSPQQVLSNHNWGIFLNVGCFALHLDLPQLFPN